jgi:hypothetical protein
MHTTQRVVQASRGRRVPRQQVTSARTNRRVGSRWRAAAVAMSLGCAAAGAKAEQSWFQFEAGIGASSCRQGRGRHLVQRRHDAQHEHPVDRRPCWNAQLNLIDAAPTLVRCRACART